MGIPAIIAIKEDETTLAMWVSFSWRGVHSEVPAELIKANSYYYWSGVKLWETDTDRQDCIWSRIKNGYWFDETWWAIGPFPLNLELEETYATYSIF